MDFLNLILIILTSGIPCALLAIGIFITYRLLDFADLTAEGSFLIGGALCVSIIKIGGDPALATVAGLFGGAVCGLITGLLNTKLKIPKLLSGIITMTAATSLAMAIMGATVEEAFTNLVVLGRYDNTIYSVFYPGGIRNMVIESAIMAAIVIVVILIIYFFFGTEYGMAIRATGINSKMARSQGINTSLATIVAVTIANALIGLAGALYAQDSRSMDIKSSAGYLVIGLASILIGESIFGKRNFKNWLISVSLGAIVYFIIVNVALELGLPTELKNLLYAILITLALCLPFIKSFFIKLFKKKKTNGGIENA
ncbi:MAG: ABC transporter permease [Bacilli bacterium]|nr:ABC transporter permease [Bacilli bacterium]